MIVSIFYRPKIRIEDDPPTAGSHNRYNSVASVIERDPIMFVGPKPIHKHTVMLCTQTKTHHKQIGSRNGGETITLLLLLLLLVLVERTNGSLLAVY